MISSLQEFLKFFSKFAGKHLCQSLCFNKVAGLRPTLLLKKTLAQVSSCAFYEMFKNTFFHRTPPVAASGEFQGWLIQTLTEYSSPWAFVTVIYVSFWVLLSIYDLWRGYLDTGERIHRWGNRNGLGRGRGNKWEELVSFLKSYSITKECKVDISIHFF